jgi:predicted pyridoxine 5'-phosphate oxidase superfamily flavin-nucleotide-binding protein
MSRIMTVSEVREIYPRPEGAAVQKRWRKLDRFMRAFIKRSPFLCLGTANAAGKADVSPRGDPPGFVQILDEETLLIPIDRATITSIRSRTLSPTRMSASSSSSPVPRKPCA